MATESFVFIAFFAIALLGTFAVIVKVTAKTRHSARVNDVAENEFRARRNTPEGKRRAVRADAAATKAAALGGIEADEAAGRTPRRRGRKVAAFRREKLSEINALRDREDTSTL